MYFKKKNSLFSEDTTTDAGEKISTTLAAKRITFISSSSSSESETDFVAVDKNDFNPDGSPAITTVSFLTGL